MATKNWPFTTPGNYTYNASKIEVVDDFAKLKPTISSNVKIWGPFNDAALSGSSIPLQIPALAFDFNGCIGNTLAKFGARSISSQTISTSAFVRWRPAGPSYFNFDVKKYTLSFWGRSADLNQVFCSLTHNGSPAGSGSLIRWFGMYNGSFRVRLEDTSGTIWSTSFGFTFNNNQWYHLELDVDLYNNKAYIFINGILKASNLSISYGTLNTPNELSIDLKTLTTLPQSYCDNIILYNDILHTSNFTPPTDENPPGTVYPSDKPDIKPVSIFTPPVITNWTGASDSVVGGGSVGYSISEDGTNYFYWNGATWAAVITVATDHCTIGEVNLNINTFDPSTPTSIIMRAVLISDGTQAVELDWMEITYDISLTFTAEVTSDTYLQTNVYTSHLFNMDDDQPADTYKQTNVYETHLFPMDDDQNSNTYLQTNVFTIGLVLPMTASVTGAGTLIGTVSTSPGIALSHSSSREWWKYPTTRIK